MRQRRALYRGAALLSRAATGPRTHDGLPGRNRACASQRRRLGFGGHGRAELRSALRADTVRRVCGYLFLERRRRRPRDQRPLHGQSSRGAARSRCENRAGGAARTQDRAAPAAAEARQRRASCRSWIAAIYSCACSNAAPAKPWPAAPAPARPLRSAGAWDYSRRSAGRFTGRHCAGYLGGSRTAYLADRTRYHGLLRVPSI